MRGLRISSRLIFRENPTMSGTGDCKAVAVQWSERFLNRVAMVLYKRLCVCHSDPLHNPLHSRTHN